mmetsp:Transcript_39783/g.89100  ORF Transcript_39783/g.89100 Transcript_39783/m.89100 type:complete len:268 (-) Transcript_39783:144-947(-)
MLKRSPPRMSNGSLSLRRSTLSSRRRMRQRGKGPRLRRRGQRRSLPPSTPRLWQPSRLRTSRKRRRCRNEGGRHRKSTQSSSLKPLLQTRRPSNMPRPPPSSLRKSTERSSRPRSRSWPRPRRTTRTSSSSLKIFTPRRWTLPSLRSRGCGMIARRPRRRPRSTRRRSSKPRSRRRLSWPRPRPSTSAISRLSTRSTGTGTRGSHFTRLAPRASPPVRPRRRTALRASLLDKPGGHAFACHDRSTPKNTQPQAGVCWAEQMREWKRD